MRILSFIIWSFIVFVINLFSDSPHGKDFNISCSNCHSTNNWSLDTAIYSFDHATTKMPLLGQHKMLNCKLCHETLVFSDAKSKTECSSCHTDIHNQTVGIYCAKCHSNISWIVNKTTEMHQQSRFPLLGVHALAECQKCHLSESLHRYEVSGIECIDCHRTNYVATTKPNHQQADFSTDCSSCHYIYSYEWSAGFNHSFFSLTLGHANIECSRCHTNSNYSNLSTDCYSCHKKDYDATANPVHTIGCYPTSCLTCHTTKPGWGPVDMKHDSKYFPINSGKHNGIACVECHVNPNDCKLFSCIDCHEHNKSKMDSEHHDEGGYMYASTSCYNCHPKGKKE